MAEKHAFEEGSSHDTCMCGHGVYDVIHYIVMDDNLWTDIKTGWPYVPDLSKPHDYMSYQGMEGRCQFCDLTLRAAVHKRKTL